MRTLSPIQPKLSSLRLLLAFWVALALSSLPVFQARVDAAQEKEGTSLEKLQSQIQELWESVDELEARLVEEEKRSAWDRIQMYGDFRIRYAYEHWNLPTQFNFPTFVEMMQFGSLLQTGQTIEDILGFLLENDLPLRKREAHTLSNDEYWDLRFRLKMQAEISDTIQFHGWMTVKHFFGAGIVDPVFNGFPNTVYYSFDAASIPSDTTVKLQRAYATWKPKAVPIILTVGRQAATDGPPRELRENRARQGTPASLLIDAEIDGIMLGLQLDKIWTSLPPTVVRGCYGTGFESGFGGGGRIEKSSANIGMFRWVSVEGLKDMKVAGGCGDTQLPFLSDKTLLSFGYFRGMNITDIPSGLTVNFPDPWGSTPQRVTATENLGDIDLLGFVLESRNFGVDWFVSAGANLFHPNGKLSQYGFGSLGNNDPRYAVQLGCSPGGDPSEDHMGYAVFTGLQFPIRPLRSKFGLEYNYGSKYWFSFTQASDDINNKLATRGHVVEPYYIQDVTKNFFVRIGYQYYRYNYSLSGWHIGEPTRVKSGGSYFYPTPKEIHNAYVLLEFLF